MDRRGFLKGLVASVVAVFLHKKTEAVQEADQSSMFWEMLQQLLEDIGTKAREGGWHHYVMEYPEEQVRRVYMYVDGTIYRAGYQDSCGQPCPAIDGDLVTVEAWIRREETGNAPSV